MLDNLIKMISNLITFPIYLGLFLGIVFYVVNTFRTEFNIKDIVFNQAFEEKYKFKDLTLKEDFNTWQKNKIKQREIK